MHCFVGKQLPVRVWQFSMHLCLVCMLLKNLAETRKPVRFLAARAFIIPGSCSQLTIPPAIFVIVYIFDNNFLKFLMRFDKIFSGGGGTETGHLKEKFNAI